MASIWAIESKPKILKNWQPHTTGGYGQEPLLKTDARKIAAYLTKGNKTHEYRAVQYVRKEETDGRH